MAKCELCGLEMLEAKDRIKTSVPEEENKVLQQAHDFQYS